MNAAITGRTQLPSREPHPPGLKLFTYHLPLIPIAPASFRRSAKFFTYSSNLMAVLKHIQSTKKHIQNGAPMPSALPTSTRTTPLRSFFRVFCVSRGLNLLFPSNFKPGISKLGHSLQKNTLRPRRALAADSTFFRRKPLKCPTLPTRHALSVRNLNLVVPPFPRFLSPRSPSSARAVIRIAAPRIVQIICTFVHITKTPKQHSTPYYPGTYKHFTHLAPKTIVHITLLSPLGALLGLFKTDRQSARVIIRQSMTSGHRDDRPQGSLARALQHDKN
jgi:hypothetical protein